MCAEKRQALHAAREPQGQQNKGQAQAQRIDDRQDATAPHVIGSSSGHGKHGRHRRANTRGPSQPEDHTQYWGTPQSAGGSALDLAVALAQRPAPHHHHPPPPHDPPPHSPPPPPLTPPPPPPPAPSPPPPPPPH